MNLFPMVDPLAAWTAAALIASLLAHAAIAKFADLPLLEQHLSVYGVTARWLSGATRALPAAEALIALALMTPLRPLAALAAAALLLLYAGAMAWHRRRGHELDCGCGGEPLPVSWPLVARNALLAAVAAVAALPTAPRGLAAADVALAAGVLAISALLYSAFNQVLRHQRRLA